MEEWQTLRDFGFNLPFQSYRGLRPCYHMNSANSIFSTALDSLRLSNFYIAAGYNFYNRRLIEIACGYNSTLCRFTNLSHDCDCVRVTQDNDICWTSTHKRLMAAANDVNALIWISLPCTGGCKFNTTENWPKGPEMRKHINRLRYSFKYMLECVKVTLRALRERGRLPIIVFELPEHNWYWTQYQLLDFCIEFGLGKYNFQGCMYGMRASVGPNKGMLIRKPWCIATNCHSLGKALATTCTHAPDEHTPIKGELTRATESYPQIIADKVHHEFRQLVLAGQCK